MTDRVGRFVWRELITDDVEAATRFYSELFGWQIKTVDMPSGPYQLIHAHGKDVAGMMKSPMPNVPPHWYSYVAVTDVDAALERAAQAGGKVVVPAMDIPEVGRFGIFMDNLGAVSAPFKSASPPNKPIERPALGEFCWESLNTTDLAASSKFYTAVYGWKEAAFGGDMVTWGVGDGPENQVASVTKAPPGVPAHWLTYVVVDKLAAARDRAKRLGGTVMVEQISVPGVGSFAVVQDPQKAVICPFEPETR